MSYQIAYCDAVSDRRQQVLADLMSARGQVQIVESITSIPQESDVALVGVDDLKAALPMLKWLVDERPQRQLLVLWEGADQALIIEAMRIGVRDIVPGAHAVTEAIQRAWTRFSSESSAGVDRPGRIIAVFSLKGGIGKSTLSANLPIAMHRTSRLPVTAVDISLPCGNLEMYLDVHPPRCVGDLLVAGKDIDQKMVQQAIAKHTSGIGLIAGPRAGTQHVLAEHSMRPLLNALCQTPGITIVDMGAYIEMAHVSVLEMADLVLIPVTPLISSVGTLPQARDYLRELGVDDKKIMAVLNHAAPEGEQVPPEVIAQLMNGRPRHELPWGGADVASSLNAGLPVCQHKPRSPLAQAIEGLSRECMVRVGLTTVVDSAAAAEPEQKASFFDKLTGLFQKKGAAHVHP